MPDCPACGGILTEQHTVDGHLVVVCTTPECGYTFEPYEFIPRPIEDHYLPGEAPGTPATEQPPAAGT